MSPSTHPAVNLLQSAMDAMAAHEWTKAQSFVTDEFELTLMPASLGSPVMKKADLASGGRVAMVFETFFHPGALKTTIHEVYEVKEDTAIMHAFSEGTSKNGTPWKNEYIYIVVVDESKTKVKMFKEFMDSGFMMGFHGKEAEAAKAKA